MQTLIIGLGTGRCGTKSLTELLNNQIDSQITHEVPPIQPYQCTPAIIEEKIKTILSRNAQFVGDIAFYHLNYIDIIRSLYSNVKFVCLKRDRKSTVQSFLRKVGKRNHWSATGPRDDWDKCFPTYDVEDKTVAINKYYDEYYSIISKHKDIPVYDMASCLNKRQPMRELLYYLGFDRPHLTFVHNRE